MEEAVIKVKGVHPGTLSGCMCQHIHVRKFKGALLKAAGVNNKLQIAFYRGTDTL